MTTNTNIGCELERLRAENERLREIVGRACETFYMMPALNGAITATIDDVRAEANQAIDEALDLLRPIAGHVALKEAPHHG